MKDYSVIDGILKDTKDKIKSVFDKGYKQGYVDGHNNEIEKVVDAEYSHGLNDAWECAKRITLPVGKGGLSPAELEKIFYSNDVTFIVTDHIFSSFTAKEAITKINEYEKMQKANDEIKTGDEVTHINLKYTGVVIGVKGNFYRIMWSDNNFSAEYEGSLQKTGKHYDAMAEILEQLKGENTDA